MSAFDQVAARRQELAGRPGPYPRIRSRDALLAAVGRSVSVFVPVAATHAVPDPSLESLVASAALTAVWVAALGHAFGAARVSPLALGAPVTAAFGAFSGAAAAAALAFWLPGIDATPHELVLMAGAVFVAAAAFESIAVARFVRRRVLVVGSPENACDLALELAAGRPLPFEYVGTVTCEGDVASTPVGVVGSSLDLVDVVARERPDVVVLATPSARGEAVSQLLTAASLDVKVVGLPEFYEHAFGRVPVHLVSPVWFMSILHLYQRPYPRFAKRLFDLVLALVVLALTLPVLFAIALLVRFSGPGPILYRQARLGEGGRVFELLKFRTMRNGAEDGSAVWAAECDPRATRVGRRLRMMHLDELPQLWNVIRGDMSIVGPRPERPEFLELLQREVPFWERRHLVTPGITGWAQLRRGYTADAAGTAEKLSYDLYYLKHRSLVLDLAIIVKTGRTVLFDCRAR